MGHRSLASEVEIKSWVLWFALGLSLIGHGVLFAFLTSVPTGITATPQSPAVEVALVSPPALPPVKVEVPVPLPPTIKPRRPVVRPPSPNRAAPPPSADPPKPVFGVTEESVVEGEGDVTVPVGNTVETEDREIAKEPPPPLPPPRLPNSSGAASVDDESITEYAKVLVEVKPEYPPLAKRLGIEGSVMLRLAVDRMGKVKSARIVKKAGYGMDEAALKAIWSFIFAPARGARHEPVESTFNYEVRFQQSRAR